VRIKKGDEWKAAFSMPEGAFKPTAMFFGLTNSPATFQAIMNDLFRDMIETEKVVAFIDGVMIATETEEGHDEIMEEVLRRMEENNLFVKPEKYMWRVREVGFLGVIIGQDGVRMEKKKVQGVVDWPVPKSVKDLHMQAYLSGNYISAVISSLNYTSPPSMVAIFLATCLMVVLQSSGYSVFHGGDTPIQFGLP